MIPLAQGQKFRGTFYDRVLRRVNDESISHFIAAVDTLRINLELRSANPKIILITSALPAEGKSTVAMLLTASSASSGKRTILLDCDLHRQTISGTLQQENRPGMSDLLCGTAEVMDVITKYPIMDRCYMIPAGSMVKNAADLLMSQRMRDLIAELRGKFDYIVMDSPPLLPVVDTSAVASVADAILLVVEWDRTPRAAISEAIKALGPETHRIAGVVLDKVNLHQLQWYSYPGGYQYRFASKYVSNV
jgi:polysaccharide biosynthesis transport protein